MTQHPRLPRVALPCTVPGGGINDDWFKQELFLKKTQQYHSEYTFNGATLTPELDHCKTLKMVMMSDKTLRHCHWAIVAAGDEPGAWTSSNNAQNTTSITLQIVQSHPIIRILSLLLLSHVHNNIHWLHKYSFWFYIHMYIKCVSISWHWGTVYANFALIIIPVIYSFIHTSTAQFTYTINSYQQLFKHKGEQSSLIV